MTPMLQTIIYNLQTFFLQYARMAAVFSAAAFVLSQKLLRFYHVTRPMVKAVLIGLLVFYLYMVAGVTLLSRLGTYTEVWNLSPFCTFQESFLSRMYIYENILMFIPYSMLLYALSRRFRKWYVIFCIGVVSSAAIELTQLITHLGSCLADDVMNNTAGMMIGFWIMKGITGIREIRRN